MFKRPKTLAVGTIVLAIAMALFFKVTVFDNLRSYNHSAAIVVPGGYISTVTVTGELRGEPFRFDAKIRCHRALSAHWQFGGWRWERHTGTVGKQLTQSDGLIVALPSVCPCSRSPTPCAPEQRVTTTQQVLAAWVDNVETITKYELVSRNDNKQSKGFGGPNAPIQNIRLQVHDGRGQFFANAFSDADISTDAIDFKMGPFRSFTGPILDIQKTQRRVFICFSVNYFDAHKASTFPELVKAIGKLNGQSGFLNFDVTDENLESWRKITFSIRRSDSLGYNLERNLQIRLPEGLKNRTPCFLFWEQEAPKIISPPDPYDIEKIIKISIDQHIYTHHSIKYKFYFDAITGKVFYFSTATRVVTQIAAKNWEGGQ